MDKESRHIQVKEISNFVEFIKSINDYYANYDGDDLVKDNFIVSSQKTNVLTENNLPKLIELNKSIYWAKQRLEQRKDVSRKLAILLSYENESGGLKEITKYCEKDIFANLKKNTNLVDLLKNIINMEEKIMKLYYETIDSVLEEVKKEKLIDVIYPLKKDKILSVKLNNIYHKLNNDILKLLGEFKLNEDNHEMLMDLARKYKDESSSGFLNPLVLKKGLKDSHIEKETLDYFKDLKVNVDTFEILKQTKNTNAKIKAINKFVFEVYVNKKSTSINKLKNVDELFNLGVIDFLTTINFKNTEGSFFNVIISNENTKEFNDLMHIFEYVFLDKNNALIHAARSYGNKLEFNGLENFVNSLDELDLLFFCERVDAFKETILFEDLQNVKTIGAQSLVLDIKKSLKKFDRVVNLKEKMNKKFEDEETASKIVRKKL